MLVKSEDEDERRQLILRDHPLPDSQTRHRDFNRLQFFDALSLFLISPWADNWGWFRDHPATFRVEVKNTRGFTYQSSMNTGNFSYTITAKVLENRKYSSKSEIQTALQRAGTDEVKITLRSNAKS